MKRIKLQDLLAPTWQERARADDALLSELAEFPDDASPWPKVVQEKIRSLKPSPEIFLSALVTFWAEVSWQQFKKRVSKSSTALDPDLKAWSSPHSILFPMTPADPPVSANILRGLWVWRFISRLGPYVTLIERQLLACLDHPEPVVWDAAESAFGTADNMTDEGFRQFLAIAERRGRGGQIWKRAQVAAKHVHGARIAMLLDGLEPGASETLTLARFEIVERFKGDAARAAYKHLLDRFPAAWSEEQLASLIRALVPLSQELGFDAQAVSEVRSLATHRNPQIQCAAIRFLTSHSPLEHRDILLTLSTSSHPWVLTALCYGLAEHPVVPPELLRTLVSLSLGNYDDYDGEPHDSAVALLTKTKHNAHIALPEIIAWWDATSSQKYVEYQQVANALDIADALGTSAVPLKAGMERALALLTSEPELEELPSLDQLGAVPEIQARLETSMIDAGTSPELASAIVDFYSGIFEAFSENAESIQKEIDERQAEFEVEQRDLYPEQFLLENYSSPDEDEFMPQEEDELVVRLRASIEKLNGSR